MYDYTDASGAAARFGLSSNHAHPRAGYSGSNRNLGDEDKENAQQNIILRNACQSPEHLDEEDDDEPVSVAQGRPSKRAGAHVDEFDTLVIDSDDMECGPSYGPNASRTEELEAPMARSEDIVRSMTRDASGGRQLSSEEEENEDEDESDTASWTKTGNMYPTSFLR